MRVGSISYSAPMIRAKREGRKKQTRRIYKAPKGYPQMDCEITATSADQWIDWGPCPYGRPGDLLIVREATWIWCRRIRNGSTKTGRQKYRYQPVGRHVVYCADDEKPARRMDDHPDHLWRYKSARFMPKWASRMTDRIKEIGVERLQEITIADAMEEGVAFEVDQPSPRDSFSALWESIHGPGSWESNPLIWVLTVETSFKNAATVLREAA